MFVDIGIVIRARQRCRVRTGVSDLKYEANLAIAVARVHDRHPCGRFHELRFSRPLVRRVVLKAIEKQHRNAFAFALRGGCKCRITERLPKPFAIRSQIEKMLFAIGVNEHRRARADDLTDRVVHRADVPRFEDVGVDMDALEAAQNCTFDEAIDRTFGEFSQPVIGLAALHCAVTEAQSLRVQVPAHVVVIRLRPLGVRQRHHHPLGQLRFHFRVVASIAAILGVLVIAFGASGKPTSWRLVVHADCRQRDERQNANDPPATCT